MKFWITKYAMTAGIQPVEADEPRAEFPGMLSVPGKTGSYTQGFHGRDWHRTREAAVARAEEMRTAKIKSLEKSLAKMKSLKFS